MWRLGTAGGDGRATLRRREMVYELEVQPPTGGATGSAYRAVARGMMTPEAIMRLQPGTRVAVRIDRRARTRVAIVP